MLKEKINKVVSDTVSRIAMEQQEICHARYKEALEAFSCREAERICKAVYDPTLPQPGVKYARFIEFGCSRANVIR